MVIVTSCSVHLWPSWHYSLQLSSVVPHVANWAELQRNEVLHSSGKKHSTCHRGLRGKGRIALYQQALYVSPSILY